MEQRVYRGLVNTPKTHQSIRAAAVATGVRADIEIWKAMCALDGDGAFVFPPERGTPLSKDNVWRRNMLPKLATHHLCAQFAMVRAGWRAPKPDEHVHHLVATQRLQLFRELAMPGRCVGGLRQGCGEQKG